MNKIESYCYQKYKSSSNNSCVIKEKNIVGKNLLEGTYFDGNGVPKMIGITKAEYLEYKKLQQENKQLKMQISAREEGCNRLEKNWNKLKEYINKMHEYFLYTNVNEIYKQSMKLDNQFPHLFNLSELNASDRILSSIYKKIQELEQGSDSNE